MASVARSRWILVLLLLVAVVAVWRTRRKPPQYSSAYVADRAATLWSTTAQVRQPVAMLGYGEKVAVLRRAGDQAEVQTDDGTHGWVDVSLLMEPDLWQRSEDLLVHAHSLTVQASGRTRNVSNVHIEPGRDTPRIYQFGRNVPVVVLERRVLPAPNSVFEKAPGDEPVPSEDDRPKQEDWLLVSRTYVAGVGSATPGATPPVASEISVGGGLPVAGWVLARFIDLDPPAPIPDYATAAGLRVVGWAVLNTAPSASGDKAQYVVAATRGSEGQPCDFTTMRVYTWGEKQQRYETAYAESDFCGVLPIRVQQTSAGPGFRFAERDKGTGERVYIMRQTTVRRIKEDDSLASGKS